jgi:hypothetical protein
MNVQDDHAGGEAALPTERARHEVRTVQFGRAFATLSLEP